MAVGVTLGCSCDIILDKNGSIGDIIKQGKKQGAIMNKLKQSFQRLMALPEDRYVLPGHRPAAIIGCEKKFNMIS